MNEDVRRLLDRKIQGVEAEPPPLPASFIAANDILKKNYLPALTEQLNKETNMDIYDNHTALVDRSPITPHTRTITNTNPDTDVLGEIRERRRHLAEHRRATKSLHQYEGLKWLNKAKKGTVIRWLRRSPGFRGGESYHVAVAVGNNLWHGDYGGSTEQLIDHLIRNQIKAKNVDRMVAK
jgi:hypothetical protein